MISEKKAKKIVDSVNRHGKAATIDKYNISIDTLSRYLRAARNKYNLNVSDRKKNALDSLESVLSDKEIRTIKRSLQANNNVDNNQSIYIEPVSDVVKFGFLTDTHIGSKSFNPNWLDMAYNEFDKQDCEFVIHGGDVTEGLSSRKGHVFELDKLGFDEQLNYAIELFSKYDIDTYVISGNHDNWYKLGMNADIVSLISNAVPNFHYLKSSTANLSIGSANLTVWHGLDGSSYATSYRVQKIIDSMPVNELPDVLLTGHTHKTGYIYDKGVHAYSGGALCKQSQYMKEKRLENHSGFWIIELGLNEYSVTYVQGRWYPL